MSAPGFADSIRGAKSYLRGAVLAVLLAPVVPDIAVDVLGERAPAWLLRTLAIVVVFGCCFGGYWWSRRRERQWAAGNQDPGLHRVERCDVLVLGLGPKSKFRPTTDREEEDELPEYLVRWTHPSTVILVETPNVTNVHEIRKNLATEGITVHVVRLSDAYDPEIALAEVPSRVTEILRSEGLSDKKINVDLTSGTVIMSLAMLRVALMVNARTVYVSQQRDENGKPKPFTQRSTSFDPRETFSAIR